MKKLVLLSIFFCLLTFSTSHALSIVTENCNISPLNAYQLQKIDVYRSTVLMSYGKISYGKNKVAFYSANNLAVASEKKLAMMFSYFPNVSPSNPDLINKWVLSTNEKLKALKQKGSVIPYPAKNGILIIKQDSVAGAYCLNNVVYYAYMDCPSLKFDERKLLAEKLINTIYPNG